ncbi:hypothetical protein R3P38DRAFT_2785831 [Favolaschia claudopus]|uniref:Uncharacterized protein n=1 Tax=Favolaschia claudopus TaxID=2862362 RepID=A0AAW0ATG4_9AGAR
MTDPLPLTKNRIGSERPLNRAENPPTGSFKWHRRPGGEAEDDTNADADDEADDVEAPLFSRYHRQSRLRLSTHAKIDHFLFNLGPNIFEKAEHDAHAGATLRTRLDGTDKTRHCLGGGQKADNKDKLEEDKGMSRANALR